MAKQARTPLAYIMDLLCVTGTDLAKEIHIDRSMVSRWRNGSVILTARSLYFNEIVRVILDLNENQGYSTLEHFFESIYKRAADQPGELRKDLIRFLSGNDFAKIGQVGNQSNSLYEAVYKVYQGRSGKHDAVRHFLEVLQDLPDGESAIGYDYDSMIYQTETPATKALQKQFLKLKGKKLQILSFINRPSNEIFNFHQFWLPICSKLNMEMYYTYDKTLPTFDYVYLIKGKMVLLGSSRNESVSDTYTAIFEDPYTIKRMEQYLATLMEGCLPMLSCHDGSNIYDSLNETDIPYYMKNEMNQYVMLEECPLLISDKKALKNISSSLQLSLQEEKLMQRYLRQSQQYYNRFFTGNKTSRLIFGLSSIYELEHEDAIEVHTLSMLLGRPVLLPSTLLLQNLYLFLQEVRNQKKIEIAFRPQTCDPFLQGTNCWLKENSFSYFHPTKGKGILVDEFTSVRANYNEANKYWQELPQQSKENDFIYDQIEQLRNRTLGAMA